MFFFFFFFGTEFSLHELKKEKKKEKGTKRGCSRMGLAVKTKVKQQGTPAARWYLFCGWWSADSISTGRLFGLAGTVSTEPPPHFPLNSHHAAVSLLATSPFTPYRCPLSHYLLPVPSHRTAVSLLATSPISPYRCLTTCYQSLLTAVPLLVLVLTTSPFSLYRCLTTTVLVLTTSPASHQGLLSRTRGGGGGGGGCMHSARGDARGGGGRVALLCSVLAKISPVSSARWISFYQRLGYFVEFGSVFFLSCAFGLR